jgi:hypothetical protein
MRGGIFVKRLTRLLILLLLLLLVSSWSWGAQLVKNPKIDADGRFWVYREKEDPLPFIPHGWMPEQAAQIINLFDLGHPNNPHSGQTCVAITIEWKDPWWTGIAWITEDQWWAEDDKGPVFDLTGAKRLVFFLRGKNGNERIQAKIGILWDKQFGDVIKKDGTAIKKPIESDWLTLTKGWKEYTFNLEGLDLLKIANGFTFVSSQRQQADEAAPLSFFIDDVYYEFSDASAESKDVKPKDNFATTWGTIKRGY